MTPAQVLEFQQSKPRDWNGALLGLDSDLGNHTKWALAIEDLPRFRRRVVRAATLWRGVVETDGTNTGDPINDWVLAAGGKLGDPWCAAFVHAVLTAAGVPCIRTVSAKRCLEQFPLTSDPLPGDLGGWVNPDETGHVFPVIGYTAEGIAGMEGNSGNRVRLTSRVREGLQFRRVLYPDSFTAMVFDAPLIVRSIADTR